MSSPRIALPTDGLIHRGGKCMGPIQLPIEASDAFLEEFNRLYGGIDLHVAPIPTQVDRNDTRASSPSRG